jgi:NAD(P)-dependent dehydrogenase (short-subunit alcohol dehydrogenase family)
MLECGGGAIVNTASVVGLTGRRGTLAYVASKHAVLSSPAWSFAARRQGRNANDGREAQAFLERVTDKVTCKL